MRAYFILQNYPQTIVYSNRLLETEKISKALRIEAKMTIAKSNMESGKFVEAIAQFNEITTLTASKSSAESRYFIAEIHFLNKEFEKAKKATQALINQVPAYSYWIAKGNILLSDIFFEQDKILEAKYILQVLIDNYKEEELKTVAKKKMELIINNEEEKRRKASETQNEGLEIEFPVSDTLDVKLFDEDIEDEMDDPDPELKIDEGEGND